LTPEQVSDIFEGLFTFTPCSGAASMFSRHLAAIVLISAALAGCASPTGADHTAADHPEPTSASANAETASTDTVGRGGNVMGGGH
jgi:hypothetical protein